MMCGGAHRDVGLHLLLHALAIPPLTPIAPSAAARGTARGDQTPLTRMSSRLSMGSAERRISFHAERGRQSNAQNARRTLSRGASAKLDERLTTCMQSVVIAGEATLDDCPSAKASTPRVQGLHHDRKNPTRVDPRRSHLMSDDDDDDSMDASGPAALLQHGCSTDKVIAGLKNWRERAHQRVTNPEAAANSTTGTLETKKLVLARRMEMRRASLTAISGDNVRIKLGPRAQAEARLRGRRGSIEAPPKARRLLGARHLVTPCLPCKLHRLHVP
jgi:hypothetical protein